MKRKMILTVLVLVCMMVLTGCFCQHEVWNEATCTAPKTCAECGKTEGEALGHVWMAATCEAPKTCETCALTEGEAKGHSWTDATCEAPKTCSVCRLTEGEALGHNWADATTEAPKTCGNCALTEGERIITDPRFTTAATKEIQGLWSTNVTVSGSVANLDGIIDEFTLSFLVDMRNDGTMFLSCELEDEEAFTTTLIDGYEKVMYDEFAGYGLDKEAADAAMEQEYGMGVREYLESTVGNIEYNELFAAIYESINLSSVYYIENGMIYTGDNWNATMDESSYTLDGDTLVIDKLFESFETEGLVVVPYLTRVTE